MPSSQLELSNLHLTYAGRPALRGVSLQIAPGNVVSLIGPSGCGKTSLLRIIAGLERADSGSVMLDGVPIDSLPPHRRDFGLVFQEYALFPHLDVAENVAFGLRIRSIPPQQVAVCVQDMLDLVGMAGYERRRIHQLSGGERQRVALARCLAPNPRLLMLDEPLAALDRLLRDRLLEELRTIIARFGMTTIFVTHDQAEAFAIADWMVLMNAGQIEQQGPPTELRRNPRTLFTARFLGLNNILDGRIIGMEETDTLVETALGLIRVRQNPTAPAPVGALVKLVIRPESADIAEGDSNMLTGRVTQRTFRGSRTTVTVQCRADLALEFELTDDADAALDSTLTLTLRPDGISLLTGEPLSAL